MVSCDTIISWLHEQVEAKLPISPDVWVRSAEQMNILVSDESDKLYDLAQKVAQMKVDRINAYEHMSMAEVKMRVEASDEYKEMCKQKAKIERIFEHIRLAKIRARATQEEIRGAY